MPESSDKSSAAEIEKRESEDPRFDPAMSMALESLSLALNRYLLRRDAFLLISDSAERKRPGIRERKLEELQAGQFALTVQLEHVLKILKAGKM